MQLTAENIAAYADTLVVQAQGAGRFLDYSEASLGVLEDSIRANDELLRAENFPEKQRNLVVFYNGCYLGETMARTLGGVWRFEENWYDSSLIFAQGEGGIQAHPFHKVFRRLTEGPNENDLARYFWELKDLLGRQLG